MLMMQALLLASDILMLGQPTPSFEMAERQSLLFLMHPTRALTLSGERHSHDPHVTHYYHWWAALNTITGVAVPKGKAQSITLLLEAVVLYLGICHRIRRDNWVSGMELHMHNRV